MPKDKDKKKKYNLRKSTQKKKKYKKNQDSDSDNSDSDWTPGCDEDFDLLEYQKFIQKVFPSKSGKERVKQLNKIDKLVKKQQKKKKLKKKKESDSSETEYEISESEEDDEDIVIKKKKKKKHKTEEEEIYDEDEYDYEYDYEYEEDVEELKNALGENQKFNIIFTIGNPNTIGEDDSEFMDFEEYQEKMLTQMVLWSKHPNNKVRRLASEGSRPRLPWAMALPSLKKNPMPIFPILDTLKNDSCEVVRRSVANNLNDISKDNPNFVIETAQKWLGYTKETDALIKHASRTLLKQGEPKTLQNEPAEVEREIAAFIVKLEAKLPTVKIERADERFTSSLAMDSLIAGGVKKKDRRRKELLDEVSATIILQSYLERKQV